MDYFMLHLSVLLMITALSAILSEVLRTVFGYLMPKRGALRVKLMSPGTQNL